MYKLPSIVRIVKCAGSSTPANKLIVKSMRPRWAGRSENAYRILVGKYLGERPLGRPRRRWVDNTKTNLREIVCVGERWMQQAQYRVQ